jgi:hypothetical protein
MSKKKLRDSQPESSLDRLARDLNRTFLHGARPQANDGSFKPAAVVTGQQIPVDVPPSGGMTFKFAIGAASGMVPVDHATANSSDAMMRAALAKPDKYFKLDVDKDVPTWVFHQREFSIPQQPVPEDVVLLSELQKILLRCPEAVVREVQRHGKPCDVSLWHCDDSTQKVSLVPPTWQTAVLLRFPLQAQQADSSLFEVRGTPQGDRYYLDQLGLLPSSTKIATPPVIDSVFFFLEDKPTAAPDRVKTWTLVRTNLTEEARHGSIRALAAEAKLPFLATEADLEDSLRLLQMVSITNSGGYFLRAETNKVITTLVVCVLLKPEPHSDGSVTVPNAANAFVYKSDSISPSVARFEGMESIQVTPFVPQGFVPFGWTRREPAQKQGDEEKFGFGTISLVDYEGVDASGKIWEHGNSVTPISPLKQLLGDHIDSALEPQLRGRSDLSRQRTSAAMRLLAPHHLQARPQSGIALNRAADLDIRYYRASMRCYDPEHGESPYAPLANAARRAITISPGFRDVFGNRFPSAGGIVQRRLFYTDALIAPGEWPGIRFNLFPSTTAGTPAVSLEVSYQPLPTSGDKISRRLRLVDIANQLKGVNGDVRVALQAPPLLQNPISLTQQITDWLYTKVIPSEQTVLNQSESEDPPPLFLSLGPYMCDGPLFHEPRLFQPEVVVTRTDESLGPQPTDLPDDPTLKAVIQRQIVRANSPVNLAWKASGSLFLKDQNRKDEFRRVAEAFQNDVSSTFQVQVGFMRDQFNQHELWLIPNELFPSPPADAVKQAEWAFATARPLSNTLGTNDFAVPDFEHEDSTVWNWKGYPLKTRHFVEQDFDELARSGFALIEAEAFRANMVTDPNVADLTRANLQAKENIARRLAIFRGMGNPTYLTPVFANGLSSLDTLAVSRIAVDAFLKNISSFYTVDTIVQLPLDRTGGEKHISVFEGRVLDPFPKDAALRANDPRKRLPAFSDVLLKSGEKKVTLLYSVPPGTHDPNDSTEIPSIQSLSLQITHVQRNLGTVTARTGTDAFNQGPWLELAAPLLLAWKGPNKCVPVAIRRFPTKPTIEIAEDTMPAAPNPLTAKEVPLLIKWGWDFSFVVQGLTSDAVHATIRYNEPDTEHVNRWAAFDQEWEPSSLLHCLIVLKQLRDRWTAISAAKRLPVLSALVTSLDKQLSAAPRTLDLLVDKQPQDQFDITFPRDANEPPAEVGYQIMHALNASISDVSPGTKDSLKRVVVTALANDPNNTAYLIGDQDTTKSVAVSNFRPSLLLTRNEKIGTEHLDLSLVYECPKVESPHEIWVHNSWPVPPAESLKYQPEQGQTLRDALKIFFDKLFNSARLDTFAVEVNACLEFRRESLLAHTPYSVVAIDMMPASVDAVADRVFIKCRDLLGTLGRDEVLAPPEVDASALRLQIKIGLKGDSVKRTLLEIAAVDFPLPGPKVKRRALSGTAKSKRRRRTSASTARRR